MRFAATTLQGQVELAKQLSVAFNRFILSEANNLFNSVLQDCGTVCRPRH